MVGDRRSSAGLVVSTLAALQLSCAHASTSAKPVEIDPQVVEQFAEYFSGFKHEAFSHLRLPDSLKASPPPHDLMTVIRVHVDGEGRITLCTIETSSGYAVWDDAARQAVEQVHPTSPPERLRNEFLRGATFAFGVMLQVNSIPPAVAPGST